MGFNLNSITNSLKDPFGDDSILRPDNMFDEFAPWNTEGEFHPLNTDSKWHPVNVFGSLMGGAGGAAGGAGAGVGSAAILAALRRQKQQDEDNQLAQQAQTQQQQNATLMSPEQQAVGQTPGQASTTGPATGNTGASDQFNATLKALRGW